MLYCQRYLSIFIFYLLNKKLVFSFQKKKKQPLGVIHLMGFC